MKIGYRLLPALIGLLILGIRPLPAADSAFNRVVFSLGLSGHVLLGVGMEHGFNEHHAVQLTIYPLFLPGKGFPLAFSTGYHYYLGGGRWRGALGGEFALLISPPDPDKRRVMPLLNLVPALQYRIDRAQVVSTRLWISYFLRGANVPLAPTAIEFRYGHSLSAHGAGRVFPELQ